MTDNANHTDDARKNTSAHEPQNKSANEKSTPLGKELHFSPPLNELTAIADENSAIMNSFVESAEMMDKIRQTSAGIMDAVGDSVRSIRNAMAHISTAVTNYNRLFEQVTASLAPLFQSLLDSGLFTDIEEQRSWHESWGKHGWVFFDEMPADVLRNAPETLAEANSLARKYIDSDTMHRMFDDLKAEIRKRSDLEEAITLFGEHRYKACAMMTCSLIDCELFKKAKRKSGARRRRVDEPLKRLEVELEEASVAAVCMAGTSAAFEFYYKDAEDFDRSKEGELNRNTLMHGMMYNKVTQTTCVKLFLLLLSIAQLMRFA